MAGRTPRPGDIVEIATEAGLAYAQYTHQHSLMGSLLRVLPGLHADRPANLRSLIEGGEAWWVFYPLKAGVAQGLAVIVGHEAIPAAARRFPLFRAAVRLGGPNEPPVWWLWDGEREWRVGSLSAEQEKLPVRAIWTHALLVQRLRETFGQLTVTPHDRSPSSEDASGETGGLASSNHWSHYLYFPHRPAAEAVGATLQSRRFGVAVRQASDRDRWLVIASAARPAEVSDAEAVQRDLRALAAAHQGEYDGWEAPT